MTKTAKTLILLLAAFFLIIGIMSSFHSKTYTELTEIQSIKGTIFKLHCPQKGAAALSLTDSAFTYNLSNKFKSDYCSDNDSQVLLGKDVTMQAVQVSDNFYQVYQLKEKDKVIISPDDIESDQASATFGLFFLAFLLVALVVYKSRPVIKK